MQECVLHIYKYKYLCLERHNVDVNTDNPDEKSIMLYVSKLYEHFWREHRATMPAKRVAHVITELLDVLGTGSEFQRYSTDLLRYANYFYLNRYSYSATPIPALHKNTHSASSYLIHSVPVPVSVSNTGGFGKTSRSLTNAPSPITFPEFCCNWPSSTRIELSKNLQSVLSQRSSCLSFFSQGKKMFTPFYNKVTSSRSFKLKH